MSAGVSTSIALQLADESPYNNSTTSGPSEATHHRYGVEMGTRMTVSKLYYWPNGVFGKPDLSRMILFAYDDPPAARRSYEELFDWEFEGITVAHGEIVDDDAREVLRRVIDESF